MARFTMCLMSRGRSSIEVHKEGCRDIQRQERLGNLNNTWLNEAPDVEAAIAAEIKDFESQDMDYRREHFHTHACCGK